MSYFSFNFISNTELQILDTTDYTGETISSITVNIIPVSEEGETTSSTIFAEDVNTPALTRVLNSPVILTLDSTSLPVNTFMDASYKMEVSIISQGEEPILRYFYLFKDLDLVVCKKKLILNLIDIDDSCAKGCDSDCSKNCDVLTFSTVLETIHEETESKNFTHVCRLHEYLKNLCSECTC